MGLNHHVFSLVFVLCLVYTSLAKSRDLTWKEAVDLVQKNNLELQSAVLNYESTHALEISARSGFFPKLSASASNNQSGGEDTTTTNSYGAQLSASQNIFSGFADLNRNRQAAANTQRALANLKSSQASLTANLKQVMASYLYAQELKNLLSAIVKRRDDNLKNIDLRFQGGRENKGSLLLSRAYLGESKNDLENSTRNLEVAIEDLKRFLGIEGEETLVVVDPVPSVGPKVQNPDFKKLSLSTPDVQALEAQARAADYAVDIAKANFSPSLDLSGYYGYGDTKFFPQKDRWGVGVTLSIPLFDGGRDYSSVKSNSYQAQSLDRQKTDLTEKTSVNLKNSYYDYLAAIEKQKLDEEFKEAAVMRAQIARSRYNNGLTSFDEWDRAETDLITRQRAALSSRRDLILKEAAWEQAQGIGVFQ